VPILSFLSNLEWEKLISPQLLQTDQRCSLGKGYNPHWKMEQEHMLPGFLYLPSGNEHIPIVDDLSTVSTPTDVYST
jgi:hypothetical protein